MNRYIPTFILLILMVIVSGCTTQRIDIDFVAIGDPGNRGDTRTEVNRYGKPDANPYGCGAVGYTYRISKYEITNGQWNTYAAATNTGINDEQANAAPDEPVTKIKWTQAAQFCNYLTSGDKQKGAYQFKDANVVHIDRPAALAVYGTIYVLPTEDEWYKAAYYKSDGSGYSLFANGLDTLPDPDDGWNYYGGPYEGPWPVGTGRQEQNGTYDIMGNVAEWNESFIIRGGRPAFGERGGSFAYRGGHKDNLASFMGSYQYTPGSLTDSFGFRIVLLRRNRRTTAAEWPTPQEAMLELEQEAPTE